MPVMITSSPWPSVIFAGDDGVSVPLTGLARFGAAVQCQAQQDQLVVVHQYSGLEGAVHQR